MKRRTRRWFLASGMATAAAWLGLPAARAEGEAASEAQAPPMVRVRAGESIQEAIDRAPPGAHVRVDPGEYVETLHVDKPLTLRGAGYRRTVVTADRDLIRWSGLPREAYRVGALNVRNTQDVDVGGFAFRGALEGVWVSASRRVRIHDCMSCEHESSGYYLWASQDCTVSRCEALDCAVGFYQGNSIDISVLRNDFHGNVGGRVPHLDDDHYPGIGVLLGNASLGCLVEGNVLRDNADWGLGLSLGVRGVTLRGNALHGNAVGVFAGERGLRMHDNNVQGNDTWGVDAQVTVDAARNWWGSVDGPGGAGPGRGDRIRAPVRVRPWREAPVRVRAVGPRRDVAD